MKAETGVTASGERARIRDARPPPYGAEHVRNRFVHVLPPLPPSRGRPRRQPDAGRPVGARRAHALPSRLPQLAGGERRRDDQRPRRRPIARTQQRFAVSENVMGTYKLAQGGKKWIKIKDGKPE
jgi:hypothetical protein